MSRREDGIGVKRDGRREVDGGTGAGVGAKGGRFGGGEFHQWWDGGDYHRLDREEKSDGRITGARNGVRPSTPMREDASAMRGVGNEGASTKTTAAKPTYMSPA